MQFGIEIQVTLSESGSICLCTMGWFIRNLGRYVYVNRGFGYHAYPGRVGIMPEITVIELKGKNVA
jgi:predicted MPP superfamily phosphohydrolase